MLTRSFNGQAVYRNQVFTLRDGTFVVRWDERLVQELLTGIYRYFDSRRDYGSAISNYQLYQLRISGRVEHFNQRYVWLLPPHQVGQFGRRRANRPEAFYLAVHNAPLESVQGILVGELGDFTARLLDGEVIILKQNGEMFRELSEAKVARRRIGGQLGELTIAFVETNVSIEDKSMSDENITRDDRLKGQLVILALPLDDERQALRDMLLTMQLQVKLASSGLEALELLEDHDAHLLIMDIDLPDMHGWQMLSKIREIRGLADLPIMIVSDHPNLGNTVAKVDYFKRPISIARLRQNIRETLIQNMRQE